MILALLLATTITTEPLKQITSVGYDMPAKIDRSARYIIYVHGRVIENQGVHPQDVRYGVYEYTDILQRMASAGFTVISEARPQETDPEVWANHVAEQIAALKKAGVPSSHITVIGASKGSVITMLVSTHVTDRNINYVLLSNCNDDILKNRKPRLHGNVLSIYDDKDVFGSTCRKFFAAAKSGLKRRKEIELHQHIGHALLYTPNPGWVEPALRWARSGGRE